MNCHVARNENERNEILRQRYDIFVKKFGYLPSSHTSEQIEIDEYDPYSLLFGIWDENLLLGSFRLVLPNAEKGLPTLNNMEIDPTFQSDLSHTAEISRIIAATDSQSVRRSIDILKLMQSEIYTVSCQHGITSWIGSIEPAFLRLLHFAKLNYITMGPLQHYIKVDRYPVILTAEAYLSSYRGAA